MVGMPALESTALFEEGEHGRDACSLEYCAVCRLSLHEEMTRMRLKHQSPLLPGAQGPGFAAVQKGTHHTSLVRLYFRVLCEVTVCPDSFGQPGGCGTCRPNASIELGLKGEAVLAR